MSRASCASKHILTRRTALTAAAACLLAARQAKAEVGMRTVALLGDSIFDNGSYVAAEEPDVIAQLWRALPPGWAATLLAVDGSTLADIPNQLARIRPEVTHLVVSIGGNDALGYSGILGEPAHSVAESLTRLAAIQDQFRRDYAQMLDQILGRKLPTACCTIYDPRYPDPSQRRIASTALSVLNDGIIREAALRRLPLLDLRAVCNDDRDFANPIEPSARGGEKIARAIAALVTTARPDGDHSVLFTG